MLTLLYVSGSFCGIIAFIQATIINLRTKRAEIVSVSDRFHNFCEVAYFCSQKFDLVGLQNGMNNFIQFFREIERKGIAIFNKDYLRYLRDLQECLIDLYTLLSSNKEFIEPYYAGKYLNCPITLFELFRNNKNKLNMFKNVIIDPIYAKNNISVNSVFGNSYLNAEQLEALVSQSEIDIEGFEQSAHWNDPPPTTEQGHEKTNKFTKFETDYNTLTQKLWSFVYGEEPQTKRRNWFINLL